METQDGPVPFTISTIPEELPQPQEATAHTMLKPGTRSLIRYKPIGDGEIDNKLKHLVYERIILWRVEETLFVATPDYMHRATRLVGRVLVIAKQPLPTMCT